MIKNRMFPSVPAITHNYLNAGETEKFIIVRHNLIEVLVAHDVKPHATTV